jgi:hypothetical protein
MAAAGAGQLRKPCAVPELTRSRAIKLNKRLLLRSNFKRVALQLPPRHRNSRAGFSPKLLSPAFIVDREGQKS